MSERKNVVISSTMYDLPEHREEVARACLRQGMFPLMMEYLPASDDEATSIALRMVDQADIYIGVFAHRYGTVPEKNNPKEISITEMEYDRAVVRKIPRCIFMIHEDHSIRFADVETGDGALKLGELKKRLLSQNLVNFFKSPADLRAQVIDSLSRLREPDPASFYYVGEIPAPPEAYVAHPYTLLQTHELFGREAELGLLTDWVANPASRLFGAHVLGITAIGGMGKSALTWKWFNDIASNAMTPRAGQMWWSFYESDASFDNFIIRALAYVTGRSVNDVENNTKPGEREDQLLNILDHEPFLIVLDGLERILVAYAPIDAVYHDENDLTSWLADFKASEKNPKAGLAETWVGRNRLSKTIDPRAGRFLGRLTHIRAARILISTRLFPAELRTITGESRNGCAEHALPGLSSLGALNLWRSFGVTGENDVLLRLFDVFENYPLIIQLLATRIARYRADPGNFERWRRDHPAFDPFSVPLVNVKSHVLRFALHRLDERLSDVLFTLAAFRLPAQYDTLVAILVGKGKLCRSEAELEAILSELEERRLLGWDIRANRYDMHPVVRGAIWNSMNDGLRRRVHKKLLVHFESLRAIGQNKVENTDDLTPAIELFSALVGLKRYNDAWHYFTTHMRDAMWHRLSASQDQVHLLSLLMSKGKSSRLKSRADQIAVLDALAHAYYLVGNPGGAIPYFRQAARLIGELKSREADSENNFSLLCHFSAALRTCGKLFESDLVARQVLRKARERENILEEALSLRYVGVTLLIRGLTSLAFQALQRSLKLFSILENAQAVGATYGYLAEARLWSDEIADASELADRAWEMALIEHRERDLVRAARIQGAVALRLSILSTAETRLLFSLNRARGIRFIEEEVRSLTALAEIQRRRGDFEGAHGYLEDTWELLERGPYAIYYVEALDVLTKLERDAGNHEGAIKSANRAHKFAWCDGVPFAFDWGLAVVRDHLNTLRTSEPSMESFDPSRFPSLPEVEINPYDQYHVNENAGP